MWCALGGVCRYLVLERVHGWRWLGLNLSEMVRWLCFHSMLQGGFALTHQLIWKYAQSLYLYCLEPSLRWTVEWNAQSRNRCFRRECTIFIDPEMWLPMSLLTILYSYIESDCIFTEITRSIYTYAFFFFFAEKLWHSDLYLSFSNLKVVSVLCITIYQKRLRTD